jgi:uncharacterized protein YbjT (DUF2867 family)
MSEAIGKRVLCVGANGAKAGLVVPQLAKRGVYVRGMDQNDGERQAVLDQGASEVVVGNLTEAAFVEEAVKGWTPSSIFHRRPSSKKPKLARRSPSLRYRRRALRSDGRHEIEVAPCRL